MPPRNIPRNIPIKKVSKKKVPLKEIGFSLSREQAMKVKYEPFKPGRYARFYNSGKGMLAPTLLMSTKQERNIGSTPGTLDPLIKKGIIDPKKINPNVAQIKYIPKEVIGPFLKGLAIEGLETERERNMLDAQFHHTPKFRKSMIESMSGVFAVIDWAEHTHQIKIDIDPEILKWIDIHSKHLNDRIF